MSLGDSSCTWCGLGSKEMRELADLRAEVAALKENRKVALTTLAEEKKFIEGKIEGVLIAVRAIGGVTTCNEEDRL